MRKSELLAGLALTACMMGAAPALAQDMAPATSAPQAEDVSANDIVITAQRREQRLQDVPLSVSAVTPLTLERQEAVTSLSLLRLFPNVSGAQITGSGANNYSIRGLSNAETAATFDSPVATYIDGIYLGRVNANNFALFDIDRIEVLRGPQGTLFGRNTTGGAISYVLRKPGKDFGGSFEGEGGNYNHYQLRGALDIPLSDSFRTRIAGYYMDEDGWAKNVTTGGSVNAHKGWGVREAISADMSPNATWDIAADYSHDVGGLIPATKVNGELISHSGLTALGSLVTGNKGDIPGNYAGNNTFGFTSTITVNMSFANLQVITGYRNLITRFNLDYFDNPSSIGGYDSVEYSTHDQLTQEVKLTGTLGKHLLDYTVGAYYFFEDNNADFTTVFRLASGTPFIDADRHVRNQTDSIAGYGQFDLHVTPTLTVTGGVRLTHDFKNIRYTDNNNPRESAHLTDQTLIAGGVPLSQTITLATPRAAITWKPTNDIMLYASATRGFKSGGWNVRATTASALTAFKAEKVWSYEGGIRSTILHGLATANLTGFYAKTQNLQIATAIATGVNSAPVFPVGNFSDFITYGGEFEGTLNPMRGLSIFANVGYDKTKYVNPTALVVSQQAACIASIQANAASRPNCGQGIVRADGGIARPLRAPEWTETLGASYEIPVGKEWRLVPSASGRWVSSFNANSAELATTQDPGYFLLAGSLGFETNDRKITLSVGCENCTNHEYLVSVIAGYTFISPPRRIYGRIGYKF